MGEDALSARRPVKTHWLAANEREWTPAHVIALDTETRTTLIDGDELLRLRLWVAVATDRRDARKATGPQRWGQGRTRYELSEWIDQATVARRSTWLYTHNLTFDLTVTDLLGGLVARGWTLGEWSTTDRAAWFRLSKDGRGLALCDSTTWFPCSLEEVGLKLGMAKVALPDNDGPDDWWWARCRRDVEILDAALGQIMAWWDGAKLGNWTVTGNGCGWNAMRHRTPKRTVLVRTDDGGSALERRAIYGGRRDATRWGDIDGGPFVTVDFEDAYPTMVANLRIPAKRLGPFDSLDPDDIAMGDGAVQALATVTVKTAEPRYPLRWGGCVWYPVGQFETVLAGPEIIDARDRGELVSVGRGYRYWCDGHMAGWARWVMDLAHGRIAGTPELAQIPAKRWGRSVPGRFAQRISERQLWGYSTSTSWGQIPLAYPASGDRGSVVDMAGQQWLVTRDHDADDCFPAVLAWVESLTRVRLNRMLDQLGEACWVSCNTDGAIVDLAASPVRPSKTARNRVVVENAGKAAGRLCDRLAASTWPLVARPKDTIDALWVAGPQTRRVDGRPQMAGVPKAARDDGAGGYTAHLWPGLAWQMEHGDRRGFVRPLARYGVPAVTVHRWAHADGSTSPIEAFIGADGATGLKPRLNVYSAQETVPLADAQSRAVARLLIP